MAVRVSTPALQACSRSDLGQAAAAPPPRGMRKGKMKLKRRAASMEDSGAGAAGAAGAAAAAGSPRLACMVCGASLDGMDALARDAHVNRCIDGQGRDPGAERLQNEAEAYQNRIVPTARGEAASVIEEATAYKERVTKEAEGEGARFKEIYQSYLIAPDITRRRLYIETLRDVLKEANKVIIDEGAEGGQGVVPYLPLNEINRNRNTDSGGQ